jgi:Putative MetA-pathway of phenol degradation
MFKTLREVMFSLAIIAGGASHAYAQQRPLVTEDPEVIGAGRILVEGGLTYERDISFPASGLRGNLLTVPTAGVSVGLGSLVEVQLDGALRKRLVITERRQAPLSDLLDFSGDRPSGIDDFLLATKIRIATETPGRPAFGLRFATKLPNASNEKGLGLDTIDFYSSLLMGKTVRSVRVVGNVGLGILSDPTNGTRQNDVLTLGASFARALTNAFEVVGELNGRVDTRSGEPPPGTESRALMRVGARFTQGTVRLDAGFLAGLTARDPSWGFTVGATYVFDAFTVP